MPRMRTCRALGCHTLTPIDHYYCEQHRSLEQAYIDSRMKWARGHQEGYQRKYNHVERYRNSGKAEQYRFYKSEQWHALRQITLERDHYLDQYALQSGQYLPANTVDHIVPIEVDPALKAKPDNLISCSPQTHKLKTKWEQAYYGTGQGNHLTGNKPVTDVKTIVKLMSHLHI